MRPSPHQAILTAPVLLLLVPSVFASQGDRSPAYQRCTAACLSSCATSTPSLSSLLLLPCPAECSYNCSTHLTDLALASSPTDAYQLLSQGGELEGLEIGSQVQFHGKWPFRRYLGTTEPLSVLFSLLNLYAHYAGLRAIGRIACGTGGGRRLKRWYRLNAWVGLNVWVWSTVYHTRDTSFTERADYCAAGMGSLYGLWLVGVRLFGGYKDAAGGGGKRWVGRWSVLLGTVGVVHCLYILLRGRIDYSYNIQANLGVGLVSIILWIAFSLLTPSSSPSPSGTSTKKVSRPSPIIPLVLLAAFTSLEVLDFAPVPSHARLLDAHALWHASTIGVVWLWYRFLIGDLVGVDAFDGGRVTGKILVPEKEARKE